MQGKGKQAILRMLYKYIKVYFTFNSHIALSFSGISELPKCFAQEVVDRRPWKGRSLSLRPPQFQARQANSPRAPSNRGARRKESK